ncbi:MAG TPA: hypothetical protein VJ276_18185 [Thermoanaerobaculia bacterium]|nr:hypothetical protein [Thermoanaerobaculia bacterium]
MVEALWDRLARIASFWTFLALFALSTIFTVFFFNPLGEAYGGEKSLDGHTMGFSPHYARERFARFTDAQLSVYLGQESTVDLIFPIVYSSMLAVAVAGLGRRARVPHWLVILPFAAALADYGENLSVIVMILRHRARLPLPELTLLFGSISSHLKWLLLTLSLAAVVWAAVARLLRPRDV